MSIRVRTLLMAAAISGSYVTSHALIIHPTFDSTVTRLSNFASIQNAVNYAAQQFASLFLDPITINIQVTATSTGSLGQSISALAPNGYTYAQLCAFLAGDAKGATDATAVANLGTTDPTPAGSTFLLATGQAKALGLISGSDPASDGTIAFNTSYSYTLDPNNRAVAGKYDFIGLCEHEFSEVIGRNMGLGTNLTGVPGAANYMAYDLFRYTAAGTRNISLSGQNVYFSINGGTTRLKYFQGPGDGTVSDWDYFRDPVDDLFNSTMGPGVQRILSAVDLTAMDVIGYDRVVPDPNTLALLGVAFLALVPRCRR